VSHPRRLLGACHIFIYRDIILSTTRTILLLRPFSISVGNVAFAAIPVCRESGSTCSFQCIVVNIRFLLTGAEDVFFQLADEWSI
jgi:hypothetical protein